MKILTNTSANISRTGSALRIGEVAVYPTDTAYALGGVYSNPRVRKKILQIKKRTDKKFTLIASSLYQVEKHFLLHPTLKQLAKKHWPGPFSIVVNDTYAIRVPKNATARRLARAAGAPLIATSFNISGTPATYTQSAVARVLKNIQEKPDIVLQAGDLAKKNPSTIVTLRDNKIVVLRQGPIKL